MTPSPSENMLPLLAPSWPLHHSAVPSGPPPHALRAQRGSVNVRRGAKQTLSAPGPDEKGPPGRPDGPRVSLSNACDYSRLPMKLSRKVNMLMKSR